MKILLLLSILAVASTYKDVDDKFNYEDYMKNRTRVKEFLYCFLDKSPCSENELHIKHHLLEATSDGCAECDATQKRGAAEVIKAFKEDFPREYLEYKAKYDVDGKHESTFEKEIDRYL